MSSKPHFTPEHSRVTLGVVTYNSEAHIESCLRSVEKHLADAIPTIIVIDNASVDDTVEKVRQIRKKYSFPIEILPQIENRGFASGVNKICDMASTHWVCLLNPDARLLTPVYPLAREIEKIIPNCGPVGGVIVDSNGLPQECGGVFPTPLMAVWDWCGLRKLFPRRNWSTTLNSNIATGSTPRRIDYPTGAFWLFRREVYLRVGKFDERFFLYFEETDFARRALNTGWPAYIHPGIRVEHIKGASFETIRGAKMPDPLVIYFESLTIYLFKHFTDWRVLNALGTIKKFLALRNWVLKDEKSARILKSFDDGISRGKKKCEITN